MTMMMGPTNNSTIKLQHPKSQQNITLVHSILEECGITPIRVSSIDTGYLLKFSSIQECEKFFSSECCKTFNSNGIKSTCPQEIRDRKSIIASNVDRFITDMPINDIMKSIKVKNNWETESVILLNKHTLLIIFCDRKHSQAALQQGMKIAHLSLPPSMLEQRIYIDVPQCRRCYIIGHTTQDCTKDKNYIVCSYCSSRNHRYTSCDHRKIDCINCHGQHVSVAFKCPARKDFVKKKRNELKHIASSAQYKTYSNAVKSSPPSTANAKTPNSKNLYNTPTQGSRVRTNLPHNNNSLIDTLIKQTKDTFMSIGIECIKAFLTVFKELLHANGISNFDFGDIESPKFENLFQTDNIKNDGSVLADILNKIVAHSNSIQTEPRVAIQSASTNYIPADPDALNISSQKHAEPQTNTNAKKKTG